MFFSIQGATGAQGEQGVQGDTGIQGVPGDAGADGTFNYIDRGNKAGYDITQASMTTDNAWYDWDISAIVGAGIRLVFLKIEIANTAAGQAGTLRTKGYTGDGNRINLTSQAPNIAFNADYWILTDSDGVIQYLFNATTWTVIRMVVRGWCVP